jgi:hypothetical protein
MNPKISVIATTGDGTRAALETAAPLAKGCGATLTVILPLNRFVRSRSQ